MARARALAQSGGSGGRAQPAAFPVPIWAGALLRAGVLALVLAGCQAQPGGETSPPFPTPFPEAATTPSFQGWVSQRILRFRAEAPNALPLGFGVQIEPFEQALQSVGEGDYELLISAGEPPDGWFVTPLGWEGVAFAVHPENRLRQLETEQLQSIFSGQTWNWEELGGAPLEIEPVIPLPGDELREYLQQALLGGRPFTPAALLGPTPELTQAMLAARPGAIAILPASALGPAARALLIDGEAPRPASVQDGGYRYRVEILAYAPQEPVGQIREWLVWLQTQD